MEKALIVIDMQNDFIDGALANQLAQAIVSPMIDYIRNFDGLVLFTRDTFGIAIKATYAEDKDDNPINIFKSPKECSFKKSQKGCYVVISSSDGELRCEDEPHFSKIYYSQNALRTAFKNGAMTIEQSLGKIRENLYGGNF